MTGVLTISPAFVICSDKWYLDCKAQFPGDTRTDLSLSLTPNTLPSNFILYQILVLPLGSLIFFCLIFFPYPVVLGWVWICVLVLVKWAQGLPAGRRRQQCKRKVPWRFFPWTIKESWQGKGISKNSPSP